MENDTAPIIIVRKKRTHGGHHGGAWKVAYADFVTAMMALFIVLWLMNSSDAVKKAIAGYFRDPAGNKQGQGTGQAGVGESLSLAQADMSQLKAKLQDAMKRLPELDKLKDQVQMTVTGEGLRIELMESETGTFFESGIAQPTGEGREMLEMLAAETGRLHYNLAIEGHTDSRPYVGRANYTNWELSADRANFARRIMEASGLNPNQVIEIRGFADQHLKNPDDPAAACNRRISVIVKYPADAGSNAGGEPGKSQ
jgi:chemotaxis protein MotB